MATSNSINANSVGIVVYSGAGVFTSVTPANDGVLISSNSGVASWLANGTTGQVLTATTGSPPSWGGGSFNYTITTVTHAQSPYQLDFGGGTDEFLAVNTSGGTVSITFPNSMSQGRVVYIKDSKGNAFTNNIALTTPGATVTFDGVTSFFLTANYQSIAVIFDGTNYEVF